MVYLRERPLDELSQELDVTLALGHVVVVHVAVLQVFRNVDENEESKALVELQLVPIVLYVNLGSGSLRELEDPGDNRVHSLGVRYLGVVIAEGNQNIKQAIFACLVRLFIFLVVGLCSLEVLGNVFGHKGMTLALLELVVREQLFRCQQKRHLL